MWRILRSGMPLPRPCDGFRISTGVPVGVVIGRFPGRLMLQLVLRIPPRLPPSPLPSSGSVGCTVRCDGQGQEGKAGGWLAGGTCLFLLGFLLCLACQELLVLLAVFFPFNSNGLDKLCNKKNKTRGLLWSAV